MHRQSEDQLSQLKSFYEAEKQRLEQRYADEKERGGRRLMQMQEEHETKLREEATNHEDDVEMLQAELSNSVEDSKQVIGHLESEIGLRG
jgi:hypothetical protein